MHFTREDTGIAITHEKMLKSVTIRDMQIEVIIKCTMHLLE